MTVQAQLADNQLDRLETLLDDPVLPEAMRLDEIQGFLCAALSGPQPIPEEDWLAEVLGGDEVLETEAGREAADLLRKFAAVLERTARGEPPVLLLLPRTTRKTWTERLPAVVSRLSRRRRYGK
jgi:uncharacterized protein